MIQLMLLFSLCCTSPNREGSIREYKITENDTLSYTLKLALDERGQPQYFFRNIFTPVCYTNECKPVYINFYWDLLGNYERYDLPEGKVLTKVDHDEFKEEDYQKLQDILAQNSSIFADLKMEDLIAKGTDNLTDSVDAKAGATLKTIKNQVIDGAVYTCYTLWHIAYGKAVPEMQKIIETYSSDALLHRFLESKNHHYQYWAMAKVMDDSGAVKKPFEKDIETIIAGKNGFIAKYALQHVGSDFLKTEQRQKWLWETYQKTGYAMQIAILKKLVKGTTKISNTLASSLQSSLPNANEEQTLLIQKILQKP
ncbi:hypothetical protein J2Y45_004441 [Dyadobacter sp. BE34]|uniref:Uncharacterized protein n=2 Tax=Dyadobacter TaxID=120831 RepID=A0ABU1R1G5_9BACT|nr:MULTISPECIES: hypothetical protein [Dyadobacter]MDR6807225.1 hypothetical protein [Dyadobacter fermentans]MDR7044966.1 hypothetical protein [Dyadobacter sp. BE242]MDR7199298.1 hypothetical protein [Dyadobacter sp. BE34]MDR7265191.1 hypothetical protein [Dyadobacter sp. BE32]